jgi:hypothetical protein
VPSSGKGHTVKSCRVRQKSTYRGCRGCGGRFLAELAPPGTPLPPHNRLYEAALRRNPSTHPIHI